MIKCIFDRTGVRMIRTEESTPICGLDFCEVCGDCLACYSEDGCGGQDSKPHFWVEYQNINEKGEKQ